MRLTSRPKPRSLPRICSWRWSCGSSPGAPGGMWASHSASYSAEYSSLSLFLEGLFILECLFIGLIGTEHIFPVLVHSRTPAAAGLGQLKAGATAQACHTQRLGCPLPPSRRLGRTLGEKQRGWDSMSLPAVGCTVEPPCSRPTPHFAFSR